MVKSSSRVQRRLVERAAAVPASPAGQPHADGAARHGGPRGRSVGGADGTAGARASPVEAVRETRRRCCTCGGHEARERLRGADEGAGLPYGTSGGDGRRRAGTEPSFAGGARPLHRFSLSLSLSCGRW
ncbi:uncharacterized protein Tco025E_08190 [Trypanosoma conorhini]|uniref:Uncharacterized protein n=1 Tax=Trypanosoma conorhini TaxID=83891 RepID=A0A3R7LUE1_9TRYP|nr:uncharacterized protein Tco025E_08190 [Trypanosoma conorhini]RNF03514.1 hypothetical protein Tco025E_08190 [Trypanosoma conorhini]